MKNWILILLALLLFSCQIGKRTTRYSYFNLNQEDRKQIIEFSSYLNEVLADVNSVKFLYPDDIDSKYLKFIKTIQMKYVRVSYRPELKGLNEPYVYAIHRRSPVFIYHEIFIYPDSIDEEEILMDLKKMDRYKKIDDKIYAVSYG